ncbi:MAG: U32 family peptidase [Nitrospirae bacterium]|nr:U32 family peptidase [Nitrospirota bacterium]
MTKPELLAPAGDLEKLRTALHYGADAVYLGDSRFSLRGKAGNFEGDELRDAVRIVQGQGKKVYVTVNIFPHNRDVRDIEEHMEFLSDVRPDAVIVSDPGVFAVCRKKAPETDIHISTQANITNTEAALFWQSLGAKRLILARELSIDEIRQIREQVSVEIETFVHGSICLSYSGRCYISSFLASRSANTGECTNSCRWNYALMEEKRKGEYLPVFEDERGTYILSSRDLCMIGYLDRLADAGIDSFKIEGRMKGINYVAGVVKVYREAVDAIGEGGEYRMNPRWLRELAMFSSRGYTTGMFFGKQPDHDYNFDGESYRMSHELVGIILKKDGDVATVALRNRLDSADLIEFLSPVIEERLFSVEAMRDHERNSICSARNEDIIFMEAPPEARVNDLIRRKKDFRSAKVEESVASGRD